MRTDEQDETDWLSHHEESCLSGVSSPETWLIMVKEVVLWKIEDCW